MSVEECPDSCRTLGIIHEFRKLYEDKMKIIEAEGAGDCNLQAKLSLQQDWIRDLNEQNEMLVRAVEELEQEATERVIALEEKLRQSSKCACEVMAGYKDLSTVFQHVDALQEDVQTLMAFIKVSALQRTWNLEDLSLRTVQVADVLFSESDNASSPSDRTVVENTKMKQDLIHKDKNLKILQQKLDDAIMCKQLMVSEMQKECTKCNEIRKSMFDIRDALTAEVADKHDVVLTLKRDVQVLEEQCKKADQQTHFKDDIIKELRKEIKQMKAEGEERATVQFSENNALQQQYKDSLKKINLLEYERNDLKKALRDQQIAHERQMASLESMVLECRPKPCATHAQQTVMEQCSISCATDPPPTTVSQCVGVCDLSCASASQTDETIALQDKDTLCECKSENVAILKAEEVKLEDVVHELQTSVSKMIVSECQIKQDKARITELEAQLCCAWDTRDSEVQAARKCREQEIANLKKVIENLVKNLDNEKARSDNLQRAVDLYHNTVDTIKESEHKFKQEVQGQRRTIQNLQEALLKTKQHLEGLQEKSHFECQEHNTLVQNLIAIVTKAEKDIQIYAEQCEEFSRLVEKLRDENIQLEETLFYNHQDLEMYEMRLAKYQALFNEAQNECGALRKELKFLESQQSGKDAFAQDLSENLADCQRELTHLFSILSDEKSAKEDQSEQIAELQTQLNQVSEKLECTLSGLEDEKRKNAKLSKMLLKNQSAAMEIQNQTRLAHEKLKASAVKMSCDAKKINALAQQIADYQSTINLLEQEQCTLKQQLEIAQLQLSNRCTDCEEFAEKVATLQKQHIDDISQYQNIISGLEETIITGELTCKQHCKDLEDTKMRVVEMHRTESKLKQDLIDKETKFHTQINQYHNEHERLISIVTNLEQQIAHLSAKLAEKEHVLEILRTNVCGQEKLSEKQEEIIRLKNEINTLIQTQVMLKADNDHIQMQLAQMRASLSANDEKHKLIIMELETCMNELHNDKEFLARKNEQLMTKMQSLQEVVTSKSECLENLQHELNEARFNRDSLCNESRQVIDHVKSWLDEQRKINAELNQRIRHKNDVIHKLKQEKSTLTSQMKQYPTSRTDGSSNKACHCCQRNHQPPQYSMQVLHSPPPRTGWSIGSVDSAPCSIADDIIDWEPENIEESCSQIWIHRVESLTEDLQRSNCYWKTKITEQEYSVSRDK